MLARRQKAPAWAGGRTDRPHRPADDRVALALCLDQLEADIKAELGTMAQQQHVCGCPICATAMLVDTERPMPAISEMRCQVRRLTCPACTMETERVYHPTFGYAPFPL